MRDEAPTEPAEPRLLILAREQVVEAQRAHEEAVAARDALKRPSKKDRNLADERVRRTKEALSKAKENLRDQEKAAAPAARRKEGAPASGATTRTTGTPAKGQGAPATDTTTLKAPDAGGPAPAGNWGPPEASDAQGDAPSKTGSASDGKAAATAAPAPPAPPASGTSKGGASQ